MDVVRSDGANHIALTGLKNLYAYPELRCAPLWAIGTSSLRDYLW